MRKPTTACTRSFPKNLDGIAIGGRIETVASDSFEGDKMQKNADQTLSRGSPLRPLLIGIDSLYVSYFIDGLGIDFEALRLQKELLQHNPGQEFAEIEFGDIRFALMRHGHFPYTFVLRNPDFSISLSEKMQPRCHVQFTSELLWREGLTRAVAQFRALLGRVGTRDTRPEQVSRVDAAFDFQIGTPDFGWDNFVSRAKKDFGVRENRKFQTFQFGQEQVVCRVYDKVAEIEQQSGKAWFFDLWGVRDGVWRAEFQIRTEALKEYGITSIDHLRAHLPKAIQDLARKHTSLRVSTKDSNRSRWPMHPMWKGLLASAEGLVDPPLKTPPASRSGSLYLLDRQLASLVGDLKSVSANLSRNSPDRPVSMQQLLRWLPRMLKHRCPPEIWQADVREKVRRRSLGL